MRALVTGATGFVGERLAAALVEAGADVRCLVRDRGRAERLERAGCELWEGDLLRPETLSGLAAGVDVAYYLVHSMGRGGAGDFVTRDRAAARAFGSAARAGGVERIVYLGGLGDARSKHLRSRHETAAILADAGPPLTYLRAAMVVGAASESYRTLLHLVQRLPVMVAPAWLKTATQPIGIDDLLAYLRRAPDIAAAAGREVQIGGADVLSYGDMLGRMARALGKRPPAMLPVPFLTPRLSSLWIGLVTPVDVAVARPLVEGLRTETVVTDRSGAEPFGIAAMSFDETLRRALGRPG